MTRSDLVIGASWVGSCLFLAYLMVRMASARSQEVRDTAAALDAGGVTILPVGSPIFIAGQQVDAACGDFIFTWPFEPDASMRQAFYLSGACDPCVRGCGILATEKLRSVSGRSLPLPDDQARAFDEAVRCIDRCRCAR
jgi:hypothetical protein